MTQEEHLDNYLKGALAGKYIDSAGREIKCQEDFSSSEDGAVLQLDAPINLPTDSKSDLCVHVRNFLQCTIDGTLLLKGDDVVRGASYEFEAPIRFEADEACYCIAFTWKAPSYPTRVKWSATVQIESQMGISLPICSAATHVTAALD